MATPFPFTAGNVLTAAQMNAIGEAGIAFTPTLTNMTIGNGSQTHTYQQVNKFVIVHGYITLGSTSTVSNSIDITTPVTAKSYGATTPIGQAFFYDSSSGVTYTASVVIGSAATTVVTLVVNGVSGAYTVRTEMSSTVPMTWAVSDQIRYQYVLEVA